MNCGIDPGRFKIGFALTDNNELLFSAIIPKAEEMIMCSALKEGSWNMLEKWRKEGSLKKVLDKRVEKVYLGDGTSSQEIKILLDASLQVEILSEYGTTIEGRALYWKLHPPIGIWKLVPLSLRTPPRDIDDLAAWAIIKQQ